MTQLISHSERLTHLHKSHLGHCDGNVKPPGEGLDGTKAVLYEVRGVALDLTVDGNDAAKFRRFHNTLRLLVLCKLYAGKNFSSK